MSHQIPARRPLGRRAQLLGAGLVAAFLLAALANVQTLQAQVAAPSSNATATSAPANTAPPALTLGAIEASTTASTNSTRAPETEPAIIVTGDELPSAYGAPGSFSRSRFSTLTNAYVLPPGGVFAALIYEGDFFTDGPPDHLFTQEMEVGLPFRFGLAVENTVEHFNGDTENSSFSIEGRWALADWDKIPLNPTIFAEYKFGTGKILHEEGPPPPPEEAEAAAGEGPPEKPDAYEFRLLLSEEIAKNVEWAFNAFFEKENTGDRGREWGFAQSVQVPVILPHERLKAGVEMQYTNFTVKDTRGSPIHRFVIGPSVAYKPTARMRFDIAPLFGVTDDSPDVQVFAIFSYVFGGGGGEAGAEAPASTRNR
ncbi:MAG TPA: hypothetical protein VH207_06750 [Chthoniobacterales bacterium]|jgi:hypothetical protein|nr:hypothetical protein [Chthoniobacterales bacterium]